jgi:hypothetical protein
MLVPLALVAAGCGSKRSATTAAAVPVTTVAHPPRLKFMARLVAATHTPKVNTRWPYSVHVATPGGAPLKATITVDIVDPVGGVHPVEFGARKQNVVRYPFTGTFRDWVIWPPRSAVGVPLVFRTTLHTARGTTALTYRVIPRR